MLHAYTTVNRISRQGHNGFILRLGCAENAPYWCETMTGIVISLKDGKLTVGAWIKGIGFSKSVWLDRRGNGLYKLLPAKKGEWVVPWCKE